MIVSLPSRGIGAAAFAVGLLLAGCSSEKDVPPTVASAPNGGTQMNTDTGTGGSFPDVNTVPNQRPTSTIQDLNKAPQGLAGAQSGTQYGGPLVGGPTSSAPPPAPPPPPPQEKLAPIPEDQTQTQGSRPPAPTPAPAAPAPQAAEAAPAEPTPAPTPAPAPEASSAPSPAPDVAEPQPSEAQAQPAPQTAEAAPQPVPEPQGEGQAIQGSTGETPTVTDDTAQPAPQPEPQQAAPAEAPQYGAEQSQPQSQIAVVPNPVPQPQAPSNAYASNYTPSSPEAYGISPPSSSLDQPYRAPANYGAPTAQAPTYASYGQSNSGGQPVALIYFDEGSSTLSPDDQSVLQQIAGMQRAYGGVVHIVGHASTGTGTESTRANAVAQQLISYGVPPVAIQTAAAGDSQPLFSEAMPSGEAANRRAEVYLAAY
jgi:outer membrane protein OmpA-like peptidoglycan-associated protein